MKKQKKENNQPQGFSPNVMLMIGGLKKEIEENKYDVEKSRLFYSVIKAALQDSFNKWAMTHILSDLPMVDIINGYDNQDVNPLFKDIKADIISFIETKAHTANVDNFMMALNESATDLDQAVINKYKNEKVENFK